MGVTITQEVADRDLLTNLAIADKRLIGVCGEEPLGKLADHQRASLVDFVFNVGAEASWTIWQDVKDGNLADVRRDG